MMRATVPSGAGRRRVAACLLLAVLAACSSPHKAAGPTKPPSPTPSPSPSPVPVVAVAPTCPLTGLAPPGGTVPSRPALAVKVPNDDGGARPQVGLDGADLIYEEPVEGGITRFVAVFQCQDAGRIEPVRSARESDPQILEQLGKPIFAHAGQSAPVGLAIAAAASAGSLIDASYSGTAYAGDFHRDSSRAAPDNLYTSTAELYKTAGPGAGVPPTPVFPYFSATSTVTATVAPSPPVEPGTVPGATLYAPFSGPAFNPTWTWVPAKGRYLRSYGGKPALLAGGAQISAANVIVQQVSVTLTQYVDAAGNHTNTLGLTGTGATAIVCRLGSCVRGTWSRPSASGLTQYLDPTGQPVPLAPGNTFVELQPDSQKATTS